jgi:hypothetical protein
MGHETANWGGRGLGYMLGRGAESWVSSYWGENPSGTPPVICRAACVVSKLQRPQELIMRASSGCKMTWVRLGRCSKGTEISLGKFVSTYFTPLTLDSRSDVVSTEDTEEIWKEAKEETMEKAKGKANRQVRTDSSMVNETEVEKSFWLSRPDDWVINEKTKKIILLEFKGLQTMGSPTSRTCGGWQRSSIPLSW